MVSDRTISLRFQNNYAGNYTKEVELWDPVLQQGTEIKAFQFLSKMTEAAGHKGETGNV